LIEDANGIEHRLDALAENQHNGSGGLLQARAGGWFGVEQNSVAEAVRRVENDEPDEYHEKR